MKKKVLGIISLLIESLFFALLCFAMGYPSSYIFCVLLLYLLLQIILGHYQSKSRLIWEEIRLLAISHFCFYIACLILMISEPVDFEPLFSNLFLSIVMFCFDVVLARYLHILLRSRFAQRVLIIGVGKEAKSLYDVCDNNRFAMMKIIGFINTGNTFDSELMEDEKIKKIIYPIQKLEAVLNQKHITEVVLTVPEISRDELNDIMNVVKKYVHSVKFIPRISGLVTFDSKIEDFDGLLVISRTTNDKSTWKRAIKRILDMLGGIVGCILLIPLTLYVRHVNRKNGDNDPIFFKQERIGIDGKLFTMYKYRTMVPNAETILNELMESDEAIREEYQTNKKLRNDPRVTEAGKFLREKSLDEFPQLINVLKGEMSLVGPRPYLPREKEDMEYYYDSIIGCKPGITGMWQCHGRNDIDFFDRCEMDDYYFHNWSLWLDITILIKTVKSVWKHDGAL